MAASAVQSAVATAAYFLLYLLIVQIFDHRIGIISLIIMSIHPILVFYDHSFEDSSLALLLLSAAMYVFFRAVDSKLILYFLSGLLIGMSMLARANFVIIFFCMAIFVFFFFKKKRVHALLYFIIPVIVLMILPIRHNYQKSGQFSFITNTGGENLFWGNNPDPHLRIMMQGYWKIPQIDVGCLGRHLQVKMIADYNAPTVDSAFRAGAMDYIRNNPGQTAFGVLTKLAMHFSNYEIPRNRNFSYLRDICFFYRLPLIPNS